MHTGLVMWRGAGHAIPLDIATAPQCGQEAGINPGDSFLQVLLENSVKLNSLPAREPESAICIRLGQCVHGEVLFGSEPASGDAAAHHEHVVLTESFARTILARVAILL